MTAGRRRGVGLLGGAFDPPHAGHLAVARAAIDRFGLDRLLVVVTGQAPHKHVETDAETRYALACAAFAGCARVEVSRHELDRPGPSYTVETARWAREKFGAVVFVVGGDEFADFLSWRDPDGVLEHVRLGVATRPGVPRERFAPVLAALRRPDRVELFEVEPVPVSSRELRALLAAGRPGGPYLPDPVARLIAQRGLYRESEEEALQQPAHDPEQPTEATSLPPVPGALELAQLVANAAGEKLATEVVVLDMREFCSFTDYFVICTGRNPRQTQAIAEEVALHVKRETRQVPASRAGEREGTWVVLDYFDVVLHVFTPEAREFYRLEELWGDVPKLAIPDGGAAQP